MTDPDRLRLVISDVRGNSVQRQSPLQSGSGGDNSGGDMTEARIAKLEAHVEHILSDIGSIKTSASETTKAVTDIRVDIAGIKPKLDAKPSKGFIVTVVLSASALLAALSVFHEKVIQVIGGH